jgi:hypothetical protein
MRLIVLPIRKRKRLNNFLLFVIRDVLIGARPFIFFTNIFLVVITSIGIDSSFIYYVFILDT